jgi:hypothetical protein
LSSLGKAFLVFSFLFLWTKQALATFAQVETFGQMDKLEKTDYILEQMRLCLDKQDYIKTQILSNKISRKMLGGNEFQVLSSA